jgi:molybdopterin/thiamine biosynthesis adenylyltransferase
MQNQNFDYQKAFSRNLGFVSKEEQKTISQKVIAIPGLGGVGGHHLHTLVRLGFSKFHISDLDHFEVHNFNRQIGAKMSTIEHSKVDVMKNMILDINPDAEVKVFKDGVNPENYEAFLNGVDYVVDGLDIYVIKERIGLFDLAYQKNIPVITAAPLGMGTSIITFSPSAMKFSDYFNIHIDMPINELLPRFIAGVNPRPRFLKYLLYPEEIDLLNGKAPSLHIGVLAATTAMASEVIKLCLHRGTVRSAPYSTTYDFFFQKKTSHYRFRGNKDWRQRILIRAIKKMLNNKRP